MVSTTVIISEDVIYYIHPEITTPNNFNARRLTANQCEVWCSTINSHGHSTTIYNTIKFEKRRMIITNAKWYASAVYASSIPELSPMEKKT